MTKNVVVDEKGNSIEYHEDARGKWARQPMSFVDENGNHLTFDVANQQWGVGIAELEQEEKFEGYTAGPENITPVDGYDKIQKDAEKYFAQHPEERPQDGYSRKVSYTTSYLKIQAFNYMKQREAEGKSSALEQVALHGQEHPERKLCYCWEQITGKMSPDAPDEEVKAALSRDSTHEIMKTHSEEMAESIARGKSSLENRVAEAQNVRYDIRTSQRGDSGKVLNITRQERTADDRTLNEDEKNYLVKRKMDRLTKQDGGR